MLDVAISTQDLAADLGMDPRDVELTLAMLAQAELDEPAEPWSSAAVPDEVASFVRGMHDPHGERTAPAGFYWPGQTPLPPRDVGPLGPDPTAAEGDYPPL